jgi:putative protein-disulfide isomerase
MNTTLHYIYDPFCGWCYAVAPLVAAARNVLVVQPHGGGMLAGGSRVQISPQFRAFVAPHDQSIAKASGQPFGDGYTKGLLFDTSAVLDSEAPIAAMLAAEQIAARGLDMIARLQIAHYVDGQRISERPVLIAIAKELGLDSQVFSSALVQVEGEVTRRHIAESRALMARIGGRGFPTFALEQNGHFRVIDAGSYLGKPQEWSAWLRTQVQTAKDTAPTTPGFACSPDGCAL